MQPISVDFIENRNTIFRNAQGDLPCKYDVGSQKFVAPPVTFGGAVPDDYEEQLRESKLKVVATKESFSKALSALKTKKAKDKKIASFDLDACYDWKEITDVIHGVVTDYHKNDTTWSNIRGAFRRVGDNAKSIQPFVGLLPDGEYKTLCGGLTLILTAMTQHSEVRERMAELLEEVPEIVNLCEQYQTLYPGRNTMQLRVNDVYTNLLIALEAIVDWYKQSAWKRGTDSLLKNSNYGKPIDQCVKNIRQSKVLLLEETQLYQAWTQKAILATAVKNNAQSYEMNSNILRVDNHVVQVSDGINALKDHFDDVIKNAQSNDKRRISELEDRVAKTAITPEHLMKELELNHSKHTHVAEVSTVLRHGLNSRAKYQNRAGWVGNTTEFQNWLGGRGKSQMLCIQGYGEFENTSPLSFLIALLYEKLESTPRTLVLPFFCGLSSVRSGPALMLRAFFIQLLASCDAHGSKDEDGLPLLSFLSHDDVANMENLCFKTYTKAVVRLLRELRKEYKAIFILIDAVDFYDEKWGDEMDDFMKNMRKLVRSFNKAADGTSGGVLRVLATASAWSELFSSPKKPMVLLDVPEHLDGSTDGFERID
ncbi:uncharacterized protein J4E88_008699 [Alternaria novae-zelandiae]|uniref:uncharacterized protein n=1 Tax=Alternaria novae-zelandiae TaxID=430562 RepID=UPI0020C2A492|nr:uncharacterized protein J4E88_008699 [Alternaria novae-zelandiae]KAI4673643.1 hypothetical protein J4E88_008699 [Alternaria novae-zelandiae]